MDRSVFVVKFKCSTVLIIKIKAQTFIVFAFILYYIVINSVCDIGRQEEAAGIGGRRDLVPRYGGEIGNDAG